MAYKEIQRINSGNGVYVSTFLADLIVDIDELPKEVAFGSTATCLENGKKYIFSPQEEWKEI